MATETAMSAREHYKQTEMGPIPKTWQVHRLRDVYTESKAMGREPLPVVSVTMHNGLVPRDSLGRRVTSALGPGEHKYADRGFLVYNTMRMWQGASGVAEGPCLVSPAYVVCEPSSDLDASYSAFWFKAPSTIATLHAHSQGVTNDRLRLYFQHFGSILIALPPLHEQQAIAEVLQSVDDSIRATQGVINQQRVVKQGLLQQLLTRGIGHTRFKQTEIGKIPESWAVVALADVASIFSGSTPNRSVAENYGGSIPWVKSGEVNLGVISSTQESLTQAGFSSIRAKWVTPGAVLVAMYGATAGKVAVLKIKATINQAIAAVIGKAGDVDDAFLARAILSQVPSLMRSVQGSGQPNLNGKSIKELRVPLPPLPEQQAIAEVLQTIDDSISSGEKGLGKLRTLKSGLMLDLLTGSVRVKVPQ